MRTPGRATSTHACPCGCGEQIARNKLACRPGWYRLPLVLRQEINLLYSAGAPAAMQHLMKVREAVQWYRDNAPAAP